MAIIVPVAVQSSDPDGDGEGRTEQRVIEGHSVVVEAGEITLEPVYVSEAKINLNSNDETLTTNCGDTEVRRNGSMNWNITVDGIVTESQLEDLRAIGETNDAITVDAEILGSRSGPYIVKDLSITHSDEMNTIDIPSNDGAKTHFCYEFQLQCKSPE